MAIRPLSALLVLLGVVPVAIWPSGQTVWWWLLAVVLLVGLDLALAPSASTLRVEREAAGVSASRSGLGAVVLSVRLGESTTTSLLVLNPSRRRVRGVLRDAWVPSAGASGNRHIVDLPPGERRRLSTKLRPTRRGDRPADRVTVRVHGPLGLAARQRSRKVGGSVRALPPFHSRKHLPSRLARLRQLDGRSAVRTRGQGTEFDSLRDYVEGDDVRSIDWRATGGKSGAAQSAQARVLHGLDQRFGIALAGQALGGKLIATLLTVLRISDVFADRACGFFGGDLRFHLVHCCLRHRILADNRNRCLLAAPDTGCRNHAHAITQRTFESGDEFIGTGQFTRQ